jgi:ketosteroid isomerase-like protein
VITSPSDVLAASPDRDPTKGARLRDPRRLGRYAVPAVIRVWIASLFLAACAGDAAMAPARPTGGSEVAAIEAVLVEFQRAIVAHDRGALLELMIDPAVPFRSRDVGTGALHEATADGFATQVGETKQAWEERFTDVVISERDGLAVLDASYQFLVDGVITNHGREVWTLIRAADGWKITMVAWTAIADR